MKKETIMIHGHGFSEEATGVFIPPIYLSAVFEQRGDTRLSDRGTELKYSREENLTTRALERVLAKLEAGEDALAFSSGMGAIATTLLSLMKKEIKIVLPMESYGSTIELANLLSEKISFRVKLSFPETESIINDIINERPDFVFLESITNPTLRVIDVIEIAKACEELNCKVIVDNTFATPILLNPIKHGAYIVIHSLTKYISGHNDTIGGAIISTSPVIRMMWDWRRILGSIMHPFEAYMTIRGIKTLHLRVERMSNTARAIAEFLKEHPKIKRVSYPGLKDSPYKRTADKIFEHKLYGGVVSFEVWGGREEAVSLLKKVKVIKPSPSLGGTESLLTYPIISASKHIPEEIRKRLGITDGLLRLSVGLEDPNDLIEDLDQAL